MEILKTQVENHGVRIFGTGTMKLVAEDWRLSLKKKQDTNEHFSRKDHTSNKK